MDRRWRKIWEHVQVDADLSFSQVSQRNFAGVCQEIFYTFEVVLWQYRDICSVMMAWTGESLG